MFRARQLNLIMKILAPIDVVGSGKSGSLEVLEEKWSKEKGKIDLERILKIKCYACIGISQ
jgi:ABC-type transport system involved in cytochrome bd biosynthesis fused ATPase/permease subunit